MVSKASPIPTLSLDALTLKPQGEILLQQRPQLATPESVGEILWSAVKDTYAHVWRETDPLSYLAYNATFKVAKDWPPQHGWVLDLVALLSAARGIERITNRVDTFLGSERRN
jgi:hypothetical protein